MTNDELDSLYSALLELLRAGAPWAAIQVEETVREGKPVARQIRRRKGEADTVAVVAVPAKLREDQFAATEELTASERALVALSVVERLLIDPAEIRRATRESMASAKVDDVLFAEPVGEPVEAGYPVAVRFDRHDRLSKLLDSVKREVRGVS